MVGNSDVGFLQRHKFAGRKALHHSHKMKLGLHRRILWRNKKVVDWLLNTQFWRLIISKYVRSPWLECVETFWMRSVLTKAASSSYRITILHARIKA
jgi:hypothetical protein